MNTILHVVSRQHWEQAAQQGMYWSDTLDTEGFIHCSTSEQIMDVANRFYYDEQDLLLLFIDADSVEAPICYRQPNDDSLANERFPHIFGPLNVDAVVWVVPFIPEEYKLFAHS
jgi:uncharacterized protein (DUF952 family)